VSVRINGESNSNPAWKSWQPIVATDFVGADNQVIGDARYQQIGKTVRYKLSFSTTFAMSGIIWGTNAFQFSLPVPAKLDSFYSSGLNITSSIGNVNMALSTSVAPDGYTSLARSTSFTGIVSLKGTNGYTAGGIPTSSSVGVVQILRTNTYTAGSSTVSYLTRTNFTVLQMPNAQQAFGVGDTWIITGTYEAA